MSKAKSELKHLEALPYFSRVELRSLPISEKNAEILIYRETVNGNIIRLKRGIYTTAQYLNSIRISGEISEYLEFLANILVKPSYISTEYILAKYELLTEAVTTITSLTTQRTTLISNSLASYHYRNIHTSVLGEFETIKAGKFQIKRATKLQALIDYLYLKKKILHEISHRSIDALRLNIHLLSANEISILKEKADATNSNKLVKVINILGEIHATG